MCVCACSIQCKKQELERAELEIDHVLCFIYFFKKDTAFSEMACRSSVLIAITVFGENFEIVISYRR